MKKRLITGSVIVLAVTLFVITRLFTPYAFDLFIGILAVMGSIEVARVLERKRMFTNIPLIATFPALVYVAISIGLHNDRPAAFYLLYLLVIIFVLFIINFLVTLLWTSNTSKEKVKYGVYESDSKYAIKKSMNSTFVMIYPAILFSLFFAVSHFFEFSFVDSLNYEKTNQIIVFFITLLFVVTMTTDSMALVVGCSLKGPKLCPLISPNKTISGAIGGTVFGSLGGVVTYLLFSLNINFKGAIETFGFAWWKILILSLIMSVIGQIGDLVASALKRSARVKDYGTIFPGHGGVMDRVDALIFNGLILLVGMFILI